MPHIARRRRSVAFWAGTAMLVVGALMLGWVGWQFWGTNWVAHRAQHQITSQLQTQWAKGGTTTQVQKKYSPKYVPKGKASALIRIPRFGKSYVVPVLEGVSEDVLAKGYGHFTQTADPGEIGNYAVAAHRVTHGQPLRRMTDLQPGDKVIVETADARYTYRLDTDPEKLVVSFTGVWVLGKVPKNPQAGGVEPAQRPGQRLITLTTCSEIFHTDNRMIAFGHLVSAVRKDG